MTNQPICFSSKEDIVELVCHSLSHYHYTIKAIHLEGSRSRLEAVARMLRLKAKCEVYFSRKGHKFKLCPCGYRLEAEGQWITKDARHIAKPDRFWAAINHSPFCTPILPSWEPQLRLALQVAYVKPTLGLNPQGEYLDDSLTPSRLDGVVSELVKRKVLKFKEDSHGR